MVEGIARALAIGSAALGFGCLLAVSAASPWPVTVLAVAASALLSMAATEAG